MSSRMLQPKWDVRKPVPPNFQHPCTVSLVWWMCWTLWVFCLVLGSCLLPIRCLRLSYICYTSSCSTYISRQLLMVAKEWHTSMVGLILASPFICYRLVRFSPPLVSVFHHHLDFLLSFRQVVLPSMPLLHLPGSASWVPRIQTLPQLVHPKQSLMINLCGYQSIQLLSCYLISFLG